MICDAISTDIPILCTSQVHMGEEGAAGCARTHICTKAFATRIYSKHSCFM